MKRLSTTTWALLIGAGVLGLWWYNTKDATPRRTRDSGYWSPDE